MSEVKRAITVVTSVLKANDAVAQAKARFSEMIEAAPVGVRLPQDERPAATTDDAGVKTNAIGLLLRVDGRQSRPFDGDRVIGADEIGA